MTFLEQLESIEDTRKDINKEYELADIIFLTMSAVLSGAKGWKGIKIFGDSQLPWLRQYRPFLTGIPTRHSIGRIIRGIKFDSFVSCFFAGINQVREAQGKEHIAFDGKVLRGSKHGDTQHALQFMTAMVVDSGIVIYQQETSDKTNEIPIMQVMLESMMIKNAIVTADAMHCQTKTAKAIIAGGGDYILQVKENQKKLLTEIKAFFDKTARENPEILEQNYYQEIDGEHGRINERHYKSLPITSWLNETDKWEKSQRVVEVERTRTIKGKVQHETSYYITSMNSATNVIAKPIRRHWSIENSQH